MSFLTIEQKRQVVIAHYEKCYKDKDGKPIKVDPNLPDAKVEEYYKKMCQLGDSERRLKEDRPKLKLILNPEKFKIAYPDKTED